MQIQDLDQKVTQLDSAIKFSGNYDTNIYQMNYSSYCTFNFSNVGINFCSGSHMLKNPWTQKEECQPALKISTNFDPNSDFFLTNKGIAFKNSFDSQELSVLDVEYMTLATLSKCLDVPKVLEMMTSPDELTRIKGKMYRELQTRVETFIRETVK